MPVKQRISPAGPFRPDAVSGQEGGTGGGVHATAQAWGVPVLPYADVDAAQLSPEQIIAQMEAAEKAPEPGLTHHKEIIHGGDEDVPAQIVVSALRSAGWTYVYHTETGERSVVNRNMLPAQLKKVRQDGKPAFTIVRPAMPPKRGAIKCLLHPEHERREEFDAMGLASCPKANLTNDYQVELHMRHKHKQAWDAIEKKRERAEKDEARALHMAILTLAAENAKPAPRGRKATEEGDEAA